MNYITLKLLLGIAFAIILAVILGIWIVKVIKGFKKTGAYHWNFKRLLGYLPLLALAGYLTFFFYSTFIKLAIRTCLN